MTADASVLVAAFAPWHERNVAARTAIADVQDLVAQAELEAYSVLTRLPTPLRAPAPVVAEYLRRRHPGARLVLGGAARRTLIARLAGLGIAGGAVYDALIAATAEAHGRELITLDRRAAANYARLGVAARLI